MVTRPLFARRKYCHKITCNGAHLLFGMKNVIDLLFFCRIFANRNIKIVLSCFSRKVVTGLLSSFKLLLIYFYILSNISKYKYQMTSTYFFIYCKLKYFLTGILKPCGHLWNSTLCLTQVIAISNIVCGHIWKWRPI